MLTCHAAVHCSWTVVRPDSCIIAAARRTPHSTTGYCAGTQAPKAGDARQWCQPQAASMQQSCARCHSAAHCKHMGTGAGWSAGSAPLCRCDHAALAARRAFAERAAPRAWSSMRQARGEGRLFGRRLCRSTIAHFTRSAAEPCAQPARAALQAPTQRHGGLREEGHQRKTIHPWRCSVRDSVRVAWP